ncbi:MAG: lipid kinase, partial [Microcoleaceae cyanobacterium]
MPNSGETSYGGNMIESAKKTALLLVNTHARKVQESLGFVVSKLQSLDLEIILRLTSSSEEFPRIIRSYQDQVDMLIIGGGDGTLNLLVDVLWETQLPLGILPMGTANDLAKTLLIPTDILAACEVIVAGEVHYIDLGCVNDKYFFNVASLGMSVKITKNLTSHEKKKWGVFAYAIAAMKMLWNYRPFHAEIHYDGQVKSVRTLQIAVGNGRYYG